MSRLIDADALEFTHLLVRSLDDGHNWHELCVTKEDIDNAPTIERPHGKWVYDNILNNWKCSECGETPKTIGYVGTMLFMEQHFKFCNHCGADMRGGKE